MPTGRFSFSTIVYNEKIILLGGLNTVHQVAGEDLPRTLKNCNYYCTLTDSWNELPSLPEGRMNASLVIISNCLYCIGGIGLTSNIFKLDLSSQENRWNIMKGNLPVIS